MPATCLWAPPHHKTIRPCLSEKVGKSGDHKNDLTTLLPGPWGHQQALVALNDLPRIPHSHTQSTNLQAYLSSGLGTQSWPRLCHGWPYAQPFLLMSRFTGWPSWMDVISFLWLSLVFRVDIFPNCYLTLLGTMARTCHNPAWVPIIEGAPHPGLTLDSQLIAPHGEPCSYCSLTPVFPHVTRKRDKEKLH